MALIFGIAFVCIGVYGLLESFKKKSKTGKYILIGASALMIIIPVLYWLDFLESNGMELVLTCLILAIVAFIQIFQKQKTGSKR
ncbi:hypothetical protein OO013_02500 [Mangrovivirga sp. M17]|uniref:Uncharacterized protein n=2 Tax=Mangrovivirga TaxID=2858886 RepID=A0A4D7JLY5_9BACT|nr:MULTISPECIES: hypothetical protein [Mangrovivirga]MCX2742716.1 hypothetical protein [Mangrovivirga halotolerans]QCK14510.1 hypothetical protein DCC35_07025 [Mangrovivirga cuniculi]